MTKITQTGTYFRAIALFGVLSSAGSCSNGEKKQAPPSKPAPTAPTQPTSRQNSQQQSQRESYRETVKLLAPVLEVDRLDGKPGLSEIEILAGGYLLEQFEGMPPSQIETKPDLQAAMKESLRAYYEALKKSQPKQQVVFLDLSEFEPYYLEKIQPIVGLTFDEWKKEFIGKLENLYRLPTGEQFNIAFVTRKPIKGEFTTVALSPKNFKDYMYADESRKALLPLSFVYEQGPNLSRFLAVIKRVTDSLSSKTPETEKMKRVTEDPEFEKLIGPGGYGRFVRRRSLEFGNPTGTDLVWIGAEAFYKTYQNSADVLAGKLILIEGTYTPWIAEDGGQNITKAIAESTAHELGHALGLEHPAAGLSHFSGQPVPFPRREGHLMDTALLRDRVRPNVSTFDEFSLDYLKFILGTHPDEGSGQ